MAAEPLIDELLACGADDWVAAAEVAWIAKSMGGAATNHEIKALSVELIQAVLVAGLMEAGDVTDGGFFAWGVPPDEAVARIERSWDQLGRLPNIGDVCWLSNTRSGNQRALAKLLSPGDFVIRRLKPFRHPFRIERRWAMMCGPLAGPRS